MNQSTGSTPVARLSEFSRRNVLKLTGASVAALGIAAVLTIPLTEAKAMIEGADNFYKSDRVTQEKVTFDDLYKMKVVGNLFFPKNLDRAAIATSGAASMTDAL